MNLEREDLNQQLREARQRLAGFQRAIESLVSSGACAAAALLEQQAVRETERVTSIERRIARAEEAARRHAFRAALSALALQLEPELAAHAARHPPQLLTIDTPDIQGFAARLEAEIADAEATVALRRRVLEAVRSLGLSALDASAVSGIVIYYEPTTATLRARPSANAYRGPNSTGRRSARVYRITDGPPERAHLVGAVVGPVAGARYHSWRQLLEAEDPAYFAQLEERRRRGSNYSAALYAQRRFGISYEVMTSG